VIFDLWFVGIVFVSSLIGISIGNAITRRLERRHRSPKPIVDLPPAYRIQEPTPYDWERERWE
jgi:hypothetical protein